MKALTLVEYGKLVYGDVPEPVPMDDEVLVEVKACGICGSDIHGLDGSTGRRLPPLVMGHEAAGVITQLGSAVSGWSVGDRVTFDSTVSCGDCWYCRRGDINLCDRRSVLGVAIEDYHRDGAFAQYVAVPARILYRIPDAVSFHHAAMTEPLSVAFHGVHLARPEVTETAVVVGTGMIGLLIVQVLRASGCGKIIAVDLEQEKLRKAQDQGADLGLDPRAPDFKERVLAETDGHGADMCLEAVGATPAIQAAIDVVRKGGRVVLVGNVSPKVEIPLQAVVSRQIALLGSCASNGEYPNCLRLIEKGQINLDPMISARPPLAEGASWFDRLYKQEPGLMKVILEP